MDTVVIILWKGTEFIALDPTRYLLDSILLPLITRVLFRGFTETWMDVRKTLILSVYFILLIADGPQRCHPACGY